MRKIDVEKALEDFKERFGVTSFEEIPLNSFKYKLITLMSDHTPETKEEFEEQISDMTDELGSLIYSATTNIEAIKRILIAIMDTILEKVERVNAFKKEKGIG